MFDENIQLQEQLEDLTKRAQELSKRADSYLSYDYRNQGKSFKNKNDNDDFQKVHREIE